MVDVEGNRIGELWEGFVEFFSGFYVCKEMKGRGFPGEDFSVCVCFSLDRVVAFYNF